MTLRYISPWDPWTFGPCLGPWDSCTVGLWDLFHFPPPPHTSHYLHLYLHPTSSYTHLPPSISSFLLLHPPNTFYFLLLLFTSSYLLLSPIITSWFSMVWYWGGGVSNDYGPFWVLDQDLSLTNIFNVPCVLYFLDFEVTPNVINIFDQHLWLIFPLWELSTDPAEAS